MLAVGTAMFGVFFFLVLFVQDVWGYSALRTGVAFLPLTVAMLAASGASTSLVARIGPRPLLLAGGVAIGGGMYWLSRMTEHGTYAGDLLGPSLLAGAGFGLLIVPLQLTALGGVAGADSGVAATWQAPVYRHALVAGFDRAFLVAAAISVLILVATITMIRSRAIPSRGSLITTCSPSVSTQVSVICGERGQFPSGGPADDEQRTKLLLAVPPLDNGRAH